MVMSKDSLDRDLQGILGDLPETATFSGDEFTVNRTNIRKELQSRDRDFIDNYQFTLIFRTRDFTQATPVKTQPTRKDKIAFEGMTYRVMMTDNSPDGVSLRVHMQAEFSGNLQ